MMNWFINQTVYTYLVFLISLIKCEWELCIVFTIVSRRQATINTIKIRHKNLHPNSMGFIMALMAHLMSNKTMSRDLYQKVNEC